MIVDINQMKKIEADSGLSSAELMERAGSVLADEIRKRCSESMNIFILCGKGNNGGDGFVIARCLHDFHIRIGLPEGKPKTPEAIDNYNRLKRSLFVKKADIPKYIEDADIIIDAVYGFGFHGILSPEIKKLFRLVNDLNKTVYAIDINSGAEADTGHADNDALHAEITFALDCYKPFHMMRKEHGLFKECILADLSLPHPRESVYFEMNEDIFLRNFPLKPENAYKGTYGKTLLIGGSYGTAGAVSLNITGAKTVGASYICCALPDECYQIVSGHHVTPVFHPFSHDNYREYILPLIKEARAVAFGSGAGRMSRKREILDMVLQYSRTPVVLDAEALNLLQHNTWVLRFAKCPVIMTPHLGEFARLLNQPPAVIKDHKIAYARAFAEKNKVYLVLKGPNTIVAAPNGDMYINQSGNQALAQAGSGDVLTGILAGMLTLTKDVWKAVCMSVWLHGYIADIGLKNHSIQNFPLEDYPNIMDRFFQEHQR